MTTTIYETHSTAARVTNAEMVSELLTAHQFNVRVNFEGGLLSFDHDMNPWGVQDNDGDHCDEEFLSKLAPYLEGELTISSVKIQGYGSPPAFSYTVTPDGDVEFKTIAAP